MPPEEDTGNNNRRPSQRISEFFPDRVPAEANNEHDALSDGNGHITTSDHKGYKLSYDPDLSKDKSKGSKPIYKEIKKLHNDPHLPPPKDPRKDLGKSQYSKIAFKGKRSPYNSLPVPKFVYDGNSVGDAPPTQLLISKLSTLSTKPSIASSLRVFGDLESLEIIQDPTTAASLGLCHVRFKSEKGPSEAHAIAEKLVKQSGQLKIDLSPVSVEFDDKGLKAKRITDKILSRREAEEAKLLEEKKRQEELERKKMKEKQREWEREREREREQRERNNYRERTSSYRNSVGSSKPYIFIHRKYLPTNGEILPKSLERAVKRQRFRPDYVVNDARGFYCVFDDPREAYDCYMNMNGFKLFHYKLVMEFIGDRPVIDEKQRQQKDNLTSASTSTSESHSHVRKDSSVSTVKNEPAPSANRSLDPVDEATNILRVELKRLLWKDLKERSIAPTVFEKLNPNRFGELVKSVERQRETENSTDNQQKTIGESQSVKNDGQELEGKDNGVKQEGQIFQSLKLSQLPSLPKFKKRSDSLPKNKKISTKTTKRDLRPLNHALDYDSEEDDASESTPATTRKGTPSADSLSSALRDTSKKRKKTRQKSLDYTSSEEEEEDDDDDDNNVKGESPPDKKVKTEDQRQNYDVDSDSEMHDAIKEDSKDAIPSDDSWSPVAGPRPLPVYEDTVGDRHIGLKEFKELVKDSEDWELIKEIFEPVKRESFDTNIGFWAWNRLQIETSNEEFDAKTIDVDLLPKFTDNMFSSSKSRGYVKVAETDKADYLPLRRKKINKPIDTLERNEPDSATHNSTNNNNNASIERSGDSSRNNRLNLRKLEKQVLETEVMSVNSLKKRKKPVKYARSSIHNWGLYAVEPIISGEMIIEYVGEIIRSELSDVRERDYLRSGIGSSYLFRVDGETVIDATKKGGIARFINHCCTPSCTAKIIKVEGEKRIVIYALRDIAADEELTYDYKFEREKGEERIPCLCGSSGCKGYLN